MLLSVTFLTTNISCLEFMKLYFIPMIATFNISTSFLIISKLYFIALIACKIQYLYCYDYRVRFKVHSFFKKNVLNATCRSKINQNLIWFFRSTSAIGRGFLLSLITPYPTIGYRFLIAHIVHSFEPICLKLCKQYTEGNAM